MRRQSTKDFLAADGHVVLHIGEHGGLDEVSGTHITAHSRLKQNARTVVVCVCKLPLVADSRTAAQQASTLLLAGLDIAHHLVELQLGHLRALHGRVQQRVSGLLDASLGLR